MNFKIEEAEKPHLYSNSKMERKKRIKKCNKVERTEGGEKIEYELMKYQ